MNKTLNLLLLIIQVILTFIVTFSVYMFFAIIDNDFGLDGIRSHIYSAGSGSYHFYTYYNFLLNSRPSDKIK